MKAVSFLVAIVLTFIPDYDRGEWRHWVDADRDCQDTRAEVLIRDNSGVITFRTDKKCVVVAGRWVCPYTGKVFVLASDMDIDHVVPLKWAHEAGGHLWTYEEKQAFANDPLNLLAVDDGTNQSKGSKGPSDWLPDLNKAEYLRKWGLVVEKYGLGKN